MCEIDVTRFVTGEDPSEYSASAAELGQNAGRIAWGNAIREAEHAPMLETPDQLEAMRQWARESGGWSRDEILAWDDDELNALFIQLVSGDMREYGLDECDDPAAWDQEAYADEHDGLGALYRGDDGRWFYYLGT